MGPKKFFSTKPRKRRFFHSSTGPTGTRVPLNLGSHFFGNFETHMGVKLTVRQEGNNNRKPSNEVNNLDCLR